MNFNLKPVKNINREPNSYEVKVIYRYQDGTLENESIFLDSRDEVGLVLAILKCKPNTEGEYSYLEVFAAFEKVFGRLYNKEEIKEMLKFTYIAMFEPNDMQYILNTFVKIRMFANERHKRCGAGNYPEVISVKASYYDTETTEWIMEIEKEN